MADASPGESRQFDYDTGGGTDLVEVSGIVFPASGGSVAAGGVLETGTSSVGALAVGGGTPNDSVDSGNPLKIGGRGQATVPTSVSTDGDRVNAWFLLNGIQNVRLVDSTGTALPGGTQYVGDAAATATPTGTINMGLANSAAPTDVSANNDAVALWALRNGAQVSAITGGAGLLVAAATTADNLALGIGLNVNSVLLAYDNTNTDLVRSIAALDAAPNVDTGILAVGMGPGWDRKQNPAGVAATNTANAVTVVVDGADAVIFHVTTIGVTPGSMIFETTADDSNWATAGAVIKLGSLETWIEGSFVPAVNDIYMVRTAGQRQVRYRVNAVYASGTATVKWTGVTGTPIIKSVEMAPAPHKIGYAQTGVTAQYTTAQTSTTIGPTVSASQRMVVVFYQIQAGGTTAGTQVTLYFGTGAYARGTNKAIFDGEFAPSATLKPGVIASPPVAFFGAADEELKITSVGNINPLTVTVWYYLVAA